MRVWAFLWIGCALSGCLPVEEAPQIELLPPPARKALDELRGNQQVRRVLVRDIRGETIYDIELEVPRATNRHVRLTSRGELKVDTRPTSVVPRSR